MSEIKAIIFDLGKVLLDFDWNKALGLVAARSPHSPQEIISLVMNDGHVIDFETGKITTADFFQHQKEIFQFAGTWQELSAFWCGIFTPIEANVALLRELAPHYRIGLLSNTNEAHIEFFEARYDFLSLFPARIYSCRTGFMKPRPEIYQAAAAALELIPQQTLFIDDLAANVEAASSLGWQTFQFRPETDLRAALARMGVKHV